VKWIAKMLAVLVLAGMAFLAVSVGVEVW
jgi:hypothetical protein